MCALLSSYIPLIDVSNSQDIIALLERQRSTYGYVFHGKAIERCDPSTAFFEIFNHCHFRIINNSESKYGFTIHPTSLVTTMTPCPKFDEALDYLLQFKKNTINRAICAWDESRLNRLQSSGSAPLAFVVSSFHKTWELQSDGDHTNASTLTKRSIEKFVGHLLDLNIMSDGDVFLDIGCSYGSLIWGIIQAITALRPSCNVQGLGLEYSDYRCYLGSHAVLRMLQHHLQSDKGHLVNLNVHMYKRNIFDCQGFGDTTIAFLFDKVFQPRLFMKYILECIRTPSLKYLINVRGAFPTAVGPVKFLANKILEETGCFVLISQLKGCKMNDGESAGALSIFKKISNVIPNIDNLLVDYPQKFRTEVSADFEKGYPFESDRQVICSNVHDSMFTNSLVSFYRNHASVDGLSAGCRKLLAKFKTKCGKIDYIRFARCEECIFCEERYPVDSISPL
jgi:hypothetical protein